MAVLHNTKEETNVVIQVTGRLPWPAVHECDLDVGDHEDWARQTVIGLTSLLNPSQVFKHHVAQSMMFFDHNVSKQTCVLP